MTAIHHTTEKRKAAMKLLARRDNAQKSDSRFSMDPELKKIYSRAVYRATHLDRTYSIVIGKKNPELDSFLETLKLDKWALLTAYNPGSKQLDDETNQRKQEELIRKIQSLGHKFLHGEASSPDGDWREPGLLVLGIQRTDAASIGQLFRQNAIVAGVVGEKSELIVCN